MKYTPKSRKLKLKYKIAIPFLVLIVLIAYFFLNVNNASKEEAKLFQVCDFSNDKTVSNIAKEYDTTYEMQDYLFYGESLALFAAPYTGESSDEMSGKTIILKDLCSDVEYANVFDIGLDQKIILGDIQPGFYEVFVVDGLKEKRLTSTTEINVSMKTITRNQKNTEVTLLSNKKLLKDYKKTLDKQYVFLEVEETTLTKDEYDIVLDPAGNDSDFTYNVSKGSEGFGLIEANEGYIATTKLKASLEAQGMKVLILRDEQEEINTYGEAGRMKRAYDAKAKLYLRLGFSQSEFPAYQGVDIVYSSHSTKVLANRIMYDLGRATDLKGSTVYMGVGDEAGVIQSPLYEGKIDGRYVYDSDLWARESGGKATQAGLYSENAVDGTGSFAKDNLYGMQGLNISLGYFSNESDVNIWREQQDPIINSLADSILVYLKVKK